MVGVGWVVGGRYAKRREKVVKIVISGQMEKRLVAA